MSDPCTCCAPPMLLADGRCARCGYAVGGEAVDMATGQKYGWQAAAIPQPIVANFEDLPVNMPAVAPERHWDAMEMEMEDLPLEVPPVAQGRVLGQARKFREAFGMAEPSPGPEEITPVSLRPTGGVGGSDANDVIERTAKFVESMASDPDNVHLQFKLLALAKRIRELKG